MTENININELKKFNNCRNNPDLENLSILQYYEKLYELSKGHPAP